LVGARLEAALAARPAAPVLPISDAKRVMVSESGERRLYPTPLGVGRSQAPDPEGAGDDERSAPRAAG
jgi:hypothetical protein